MNWARFVCASGAWLWAGVGLVLVAAAWTASDTGAQEVRVPDDWVGTGFVVSQPSMRDGKTATCGLLFRAFIQDRIYRQGEPSIVSGSFGLAKVGDSVSGFLKVVVEDLSMENGDLHKSFATPVSSYLATKDGQTTVSSRREMSLTEPGTLFTVFVADNAFFRVVEAAITSGAATVWFSRRQSGLDVPVELDLSVAATEHGRQVHSTKELAAFLDSLPRLQQ
jgi:hypothetical protein